MAKPRKKRKISFKQRVRIIEKSDATKVAKPDTTGLRRAPTRVPNNGATFKIKIKRRNG